MFKKIKRGFIGRYFATFELVSRNKLFLVSLIFIVLPALFFYLWQNKETKFMDLEFFSFLHSLYIYLKSSFINEYVGMTIFFIIIVPLIFQMAIAFFYWVILELGLFIKISLLKKDKEVEIDNFFRDIKIKINKINLEEKNEKNLQNLADKINKKIK